MKYCEDCVWWEKTERFNDFGICKSKKLIDIDLKTLLLTLPEVNEIGCNMLVSVGDFVTEQAVNLFHRHYGCVNHVKLSERTNEKKAETEEKSDRESEKERPKGNW